ncbi:hypothetical protein [Nocardioides litoris]|uniref:hypothetical protein n=1 Tax=Nocardioides litoris TaxID=1926648 RepID=UPI0011215564|nr:hypothetical protein [Nocardioides litoris]
MRPARLPLLLPAAALVLAGCSAATADAEDLRATIAEADEEAEDCPVDLDPGDALDEVGRSSEVTAVAASREVSQTDEPAGDPLTAQQDGATVLDVTAGAYLQCTFEVGGDGELEVDVFVSRGPEASAALAMLPQTIKESGGDTEGAQRTADDVDEEGAVVVLPDGVVLADVPTDDGDGDAALLVFGDAVDGLDDGDLEEVAQELVGDLTS